MFRMTKVGSGLMIAFGSVVIGATPPVFAQQTLERVEITGSSIRRIESEGALPVQIVTREDIARTGVTSTEQLLASITAASSSGGTVNATGAGSSTYGYSTISLHGLGEERTLVLVNGRRLATFAGAGGGSANGGAAVNVNAIPLAAIERVEILKDGASGVYGSDAIAGVVNFILTKEFTGLDLSVTSGRPTRSGGGKNNGVAAVFGIGDLSKDRFNLTVSGSLEKETALFAKDRSFARTGNQFPYIVAGATGQGNIEGSYTSSATGAGPTYVEGTRGAGFGASPGTGFGNPLAATDNCESINMFLNPTLTSKRLPYCTFDSNAFVGLIPERNLTNLSANGAFKISNEIELFGDALYSKSVVTQSFQPSPLRRSFMTTDGEFALQGVDPALKLISTNPNYQLARNYLLNLPPLPPGSTPAQQTAYNQAVLDAAAMVNANQPLAITARVFDFGPRTSKDTATQRRLVFGSRGTVFGQDYEAAFAHNKQTTSGTVPDGYFSQVRYARVVSSSNTWNPWSLSQSPAFLAELAAAGAKYTGSTTENESTSNGVDVKVTGELFDMPGGKSLYAAGSQFRKEDFVINPSPAQFTGDIAGLGGASAPVDRSRKIASLFGELSMPVLKTLEGTLALRGDKYQGVGETVNYKGSLRWAPNQQVILRGSVGSSFRAPTLGELWTPQTIGTSEQFTDPGTGEANLQVNAINGGVSTLKPEKATQTTLGIVLAPSSSFSATLDWFNIDIKNFIQNPSAQLLVSRFRAGDPAYAGLVTLDANGDVALIDQRLSNTGGAKVSGIDVDLRWRESYGSAKLNVNLLGTYMIQFEETTPSGAKSYKVGTIVDETGAPVAGAENGGVVLRWKHALTGVWSDGPWAFTLAQNFASRYEAGNRQIDGVRHFMPSFVTYDANIAFTGLKNLRLAVGARNVFDKDPSIFVPASNQFQAGYDITQYDPRGRFIYINAGYRF
jgi:iron complex outermembrane recepter protein